MNAPNAPRSRPRRLSDGGRAPTCQVSLSPLQAAWLASQGIPASAVLRMLVDDAMAAEPEPKVGAAVSDPVDILRLFFASAGLQEVPVDLSDRSLPSPDPALQSP